MTKKILGAAIVAAVAGISGVTSAATYTFDSGNLHGTAVVTVEASDIKVVLTNTTTNTSDAGDLLTAFQFDGIGALTVLHEPGDTTPLTLRTLGGNPAVKDVAGDATSLTGQWTINNAKTKGDSLNFSPQPNFGIISANLGSPNPSLTGNHNPYILTTGTWFLSKGTFTSDADFDDVKLYFGTDLETSIPGTPGGGGTPEPASLGVLSIGAIGLLARRRRKA